MLPNNREFCVSKWNNKNQQNNTPNNNDDDYDDDDYDNDDNDDDKVRWTSLKELCKYLSISICDNAKHLNKRAHAEEEEIIEWIIKKTTHHTHTLTHSLANSSIQLFSSSAECMDVCVCWEKTESEMKKTMKQSDEKRKWQ